MVYGLLELNLKDYLKRPDFDKKRFITVGPFQGDSEDDAIEAASEVALRRIFEHYGYLSFDRSSSPEN